MNTDWIISKLDNFILITTPTGWDSGSFIQVCTYDYSESEILKSRVAIDQILATILPDWRNRFDGSAEDKYKEIREACIYAKTALLEQHEIKLNLEPDRPVITLSNVHPKVLNVCGDLFAQGHYKEAISNASNSVLAFMNDFSKCKNLSGLQLVNELFSDNPPLPDRPRVLSPSFSTRESETNFRLGLKGLAMSVVGLMRNLSNHEPIEYTKDECVEYLATMSLFLRNLEKCSLNVSE